ncbi:flavin oxidoreductase / NADH oxidase family protein, partial [Vibrio parahaemolyticus IDH02189]
SDDEG